MAIKYIWDTNTAIYYLQQQFPIEAEKFIDDSLKEAHPCISAITEIELLSWKTANENDIEVIHHFISDAFVIELERPIKLKAADIRKVYGIKLPDAIIAATTLVYGLTLITRNINDFRNIKGISILNPFDL
jgi:predicted nucleic acid-binding protein